MVLLVGFCSYGFAKLKEPVPLFEATSAIKIDRFSNMASILTGEYWRQSENMVTHAYIITSFPVLCQTAWSLGWIPEKYLAGRHSGLPKISLHYPAPQVPGRTGASGGHQHY